ATRRVVSSRMPGALRVQTPATTARAVRHGMGPRRRESACSNPAGVLLLARNSWTCELSVPDGLRFENGGASRKRRREVCLLGDILVGPEATVVPQSPDVGPVTKLVGFGGW